MNIRPSHNTLRVPRESKAGLRERTGTHVCLPLRWNVEEQ